MSSPDSAEVVEEVDDRALLDAVVSATDSGRTCAVLDPRWPVALRDAARNLVATHPVGPGRLVLFTSGSTGKPRAVVRTHASWVASLDPLTEVTGATPDDVVHVAGPLTSTMYLYAAWHARHLGARVVTADNMSATLAHVVPTRLSGMVERPADWPALRTVVVAGDRLPRALRAAAVALGWRVVEYYGAAELSFVAWRADDGPLRPFPGARLEVRRGELWVSSPYLAEGYLPPPVIMQSGVIMHFDPGPLRRDGGWATVGDLARSVDGGVEVLGRGSASVVTGGHTVVAEEVEAAVTALGDVTGAVVVGVPDARLGEVVAAVVTGRGLIRHQLDAGVRPLPSPARPRRWYVAEAVPTTPAGKPDRAAALAAVLAGDYPALR